MGGSWTVSKTWISGEVLTAADLNAEFQNVIDNDVPNLSDDYSSSVAQMQTETDPGELSSESQATSLAGEIERLRYAIREVKGTTHWYESASTNLDSIANAEKSLHIGLEFEGKLGGASSTTDVLAKFINQGGIINASSLSSADVAAGDFGTSNVKFGTYSYSMASGNIMAFPATHGNPVKGTVSLWHRNTAASDYLAYNPLLGLELFLDSSGFLTWKATEAAATAEDTKATTTVVGSASVAGDTSFANVTAKWRFNDEGGASTDLMQLERDATDVGTQIGSDNIDINPGLGGVWFFGAGRNDPTWDHFYAANGLPTAHSDAWTGSGNNAGNSVSGGVLNISGQGATESNAYNKTNNVDLSQMTCEFKMKVNSVAGRSAVEHLALAVQIRDDSMDRTVRLAFTEDSVMLIFVATSGNNLVVYEAKLNTKEKHVYRITTSGATSPTVNLYIDGVLVFSQANATADTASTDDVRFGDFSTTSGETSDSDWEWFAYFDAGATAPISAGSQGELDSIGVNSEVVSDAVITALQNSQVTSVFGKTPSYGITLPYTAMFDRDNVTISLNSTTFEDVGNAVYYLAGDGLTETEITYAAPIATSSTAGHDFAMIIDINDDQFGETSVNVYGSGKRQTSTADAEQTIVARRSAILPVGLNEIRPNALTSNVAASWSVQQEREAVFECSTRKSEDI